MDPITWTLIGGLGIGGASWLISRFRPGWLRELDRLQPFLELAFNAVEAVAGRFGWSGPAKLREYKQRVEDLTGRPLTADGIRAAEAYAKQRAEAAKAHVDKLKTAALSEIDRRVAELEATFARAEQLWQKGK